MNTKAPAKPISQSRRPRSASSESRRPVGRVATAGVCAAVRVAIEVRPFRTDQQTPFVPAQALEYAHIFARSIRDPHPDEAAHPRVRPSRRMATHSVLAQWCSRLSFETQCGRQAADRIAPQDEG